MGAARVRSGQGPGLRENNTQDSNGIKIEGPGAAFILMGLHEKRSSSFEHDSG